MKHPVQPLEKDKQGILRFKENRIVRFLLVVLIIEGVRIGNEQVS